MSFKTVLGDLEWTIFFLAQPWWATFNISLALFLLGKLTKHFWKVKSNPEFCSEKWRNCSLNADQESIVMVTIVVTANALSWWQLLLWLQMQLVEEQGPFFWNILNSTKDIRLPAICSSWFSYAMVNFWGNDIYVPIFFCRSLPLKINFVIKKNKIIFFTIKNYYIFT